MDIKNTASKLNNDENDEWKEKLSPQEYYVMRQKGTEPPFTGKYNLHFEKGIYTCKGCGTPLFTSEFKFNSGCGWPAFDNALPDTIETRRDTSHGMIRTEIICKNCQSHLGHLFDDGPTETGLRYCVNSVCLNFKEEK
jgi:peptide-methionine (R)-S-oxide reductase